MGIFSALPNFFKKQKFKKFNQSQTEALLDLLVYMMAVDGHVAQQERDELEKAANHLEWSASATPHAYIEHAEQRLATDGAGDFVTQIAEALDEEWMRKEAYLLAGKVANADRGIVSEETEVLQALNTAFGFDRTTMRLLTQQLIQEDDV